MVFSREALLDQADRAAATTTTETNSPKAHVSSWGSTAGDWSYRHWWPICTSNNEEIPVSASSSGRFSLRLLLLGSSSSAATATYRYASPATTTTTTTTFVAQSPETLALLDSGCRHHTDDDDDDTATPSSAESHSCSTASLPSSLSSPSTSRHGKTPSYDSIASTPLQTEDSVHAIVDSFETSTAATTAGMMNGHYEDQDNSDSENYRNGNFRGRHVDPMYIEDSPVHNNSNDNTIVVHSGQVIVHRRRRDSRRSATNSDNSNSGFYSDDDDENDDPDGAFAGNDDDFRRSAFCRDDCHDESNNNSNSITTNGDEMTNGTSPVSSRDDSTTATTTPHIHGERLGVIPLAVLVFYNVSGGPFGVEASVRSAGNFYTLLGFLIAPAVWSIQEAAMTAELGSTFPEESGGVAWVQEAFGPFAGWMAGYLGWVAGATDNAIYPVLFLDYLLEVLNRDGDQINAHLRFMLLSTCSLALAYVNWMGLSVVGNMSVLICVLAMSPFIILTVVGAFKVDPSLWFRMPSPDLDTVESITDDDIGGGFFPNAVMGNILWRPFLNNLFWNLNSYDSAASYSADVDDPGRVFPRAMFWSVVLVVGGYLFPLAVGLGASDVPQHEWVDGYFAKLASDVVGPWLGAWTVFAAGISNIALFQAELSADAFQLMGMADRGHLPKIFGTRSRHGTPTYGIMLGTAVIIVMGVSDLDKLIEMLNFNYAISLLMEYLSFLKLRISRPDLDRPWKIPLNTFGCFLFFLPTLILTLVILVLATYTTFVFCLATNIVGMFLFYTFQRDLWKKSRVFCRTRFGRYHPIPAVAAVNNNNSTSSSSQDGSIHEMRETTTMTTIHGDHHNDPLGYNDDHRHHHDNSVGTGRVAAVAASTGGLLHHSHALTELIEPQIV